MLVKWWDLSETLRPVGVTGITNVGNWLTTLKTNTSFTLYFDELTDGTITRKFANILSIEEEAVLKFYTTNEGYKTLIRH